MKLSYTTFFGMLGAMTFAVSQVVGLPALVHLVCVCVSAACVAGLGYHAVDQTPRPPVPPLVLFAAMLIAFAVMLAGCKVGGLGVSVSSPAFGSVGLSLDGGVIGKGHTPTNAPTPIALPK
jgi:hypothetical protein